MIQAINTYQIEVRGEVDIRIINANSPLQMNVIQTDLDATIFEVSTDQSGLIGLIRHLHGQGFVLLFVQRQTNEAIIVKEKPNHE